MGALTPVVGLRKGIRERIYNRETSRLSRRCTTCELSAGRIAKGVNS